MEEEESKKKKKKAPKHGDLMLWKTRHATIGIKKPLSNWTN